MKKWIFCVVTVLALCNTIAKAQTGRDTSAGGLDLRNSVEGLDLRPAATYGPPTALDFDEGYYNECILKNVKPGVDRSATGVIMQACKYKATPKKCRALSDEGLLYPSERSMCVDACKTEGYYSRTFGSCSTG